MSAPTVDRAADLLRQAEEAATIRAHQTDPAVVALAVERTRDGIERAMWVGIVIGMAFTAVTVQQWASGGGVRTDDPAWWAAWLLAPLVEIPLIVILRAEQVLGRYHVRPGRVVLRTRRGLLAAAFLMNTYAAWAALLGGLWGFDELIQHTIPVLAVLAGAEVLTDLREKFGAVLTKAIAAAAAARPTPRPATRPREPRTRPEREQTPPPPPPPPVDPPADDRGIRETGIEWALTHWDGDHRDPKGRPCEIRPMHVRDALLAMGRRASKGEHSRILRDARAIRIERGLPVGPDTDAAEEGIG